MGRKIRIDQGVMVRRDVGPKGDCDTIFDSTGK